ncbi:MAG: pilin [bacterium]|nr:pilin [bacterium]
MKKLIASSIFLFLLSVTFVHATSTATITHDPSGTAKLSCPEGEICLDNPLGIDSPQELVARIINNVLGIVGTLALVMFIYGGLIWMTSSGSSEKVKQGRDIILWSVIGLVVIFSAYAIVRFVIQGIGA